MNEPSSPRNPVAPDLSSFERQAEELDARDPLAGFRQRFDLAQNLVYLDGNSLGALPTRTAAALERTVHEEWGRDLVSSWNRAGWYELPLEVGDTLGNLLGAARGQIAVCDTTTLSLFKALWAACFLQQTRGRCVVLVDESDFPANLYISQSVCDALPKEHAMQRRALPAGADVVQHIREHAESLAVVCLSQVNYRTGALFDLEEITRAAHEVGALVVWDLCHSAGVLPIALDQAEVDFAVGCTYKYLNGGPGAPAFVYVAQRHLGKATQPLSGWMGHADPFAFETGYRQHAGIRGFLCGTPHILSLRAAQEGLESYAGVDLNQVREKSMQMTELFFAAVRSVAPDLQLLSPRQAELRGSQVTFAHAEGFAVVQAMADRGVVGDFRAPDGIRFGFAPLYLSYRDAVSAAATLLSCLQDEVWSPSSPAFRDSYARRAAVT